MVQCKKTNPPPLLVPPHLHPPPHKADYLPDDQFICNEFSNEESILYFPEFHSIDDVDDSSETLGEFIPCQCHGKPEGSCSKYINSVIKFVQEVFESGKSNQDHARKPLPYSKLSVNFWRKSLENYFDGESVANAVEYGWDLGFRVGGPKLLWDWQKLAPSNHPSALNFCDQVDKYLFKEQTRGTLVGPLPLDLHFPVFVSPVGTVEKPGSQTVRRVIVDSSYPRGRGVNSFIHKDFYRGKVVRTKLPNIDTIVEMVRKAKEKYPGRRLLGFKVDLDAYYRYLNTNPGETPYQCIVWRDQLYLDLSWSFGLRSAVQAAQRQSEALAWIFRTQVPPAPGQANTGQDCKCLQKCTCGDNEMCSYIDDFLSIVPEEQANHLWDRFTKDVVAKSGHRLSQTPNHLCPPAEVFIGLGIEFDLVKNEARIPPAKLDKVNQLVSKWYGYRFANRKQLQEVLGYLHHVSQCVRVGRLMVSRMLADLREAYKVFPEQITLSEGFKTDLRWWKYQLEHWNGISILDHKQRRGIVTLDASKCGEHGGKPGLGAYNFATHEYYHRPVPDHMLDWDIGDLELVNHLVVARVWGPTWDGVEVTGYTDNQSAMHLLRHGRSRSELRLDIAREFASLQQHFHFLWRSEYVNTKDNVLSDCLSRWGSDSARETFTQLTAGTRISEIFIPDSFLKINATW